MHVVVRKYRLAGSSEELMRRAKEEIVPVIRALPGSDAVEAGVTERQCLGVAGLEGDTGRKPLRCLDHAFADVDACHCCAARGEAPGGPPGSGGDVEKAFARFRPDTIDDVVDRVGNAVADDIVSLTTRTPGGTRF
jgi:hypothetical protein